MYCEQLLQEELKKSQQEKELVQQRARSVLKHRRSSTQDWSSRAFGTRIHVTEWAILLLITNKVACAYTNNLIRTRARADCI